MEIKTERLIIIPLNAFDLELLIKDTKLYENKYNISYKAEPIEGIFKEIVSFQKDKVHNDSDNYIWHTFWMIIDPSINTIIGSIDFKDVPQNGVVEIGYGLGKEYEHHGFMTETVKAFCNFAFSNGVSEIIAETEK